MNTITSATVPIAACPLTFALCIIIAGHDSMLPYGGYGGEGVNIASPYSLELSSFS